MFADAADFLAHLDFIDDGRASRGEGQHQHDVEEEEEEEEEEDETSSVWLGAHYFSIQVSTLK